MRVISLELKNFRGVTACSLELDGQHGLVRAGNGAGKTSVLDSLVWALGGKVEDKIDAPRKIGAHDDTRVSLDLGEYTVERVISTQGTKALTVRNKQGEKQARPQEFLNSLVPSGIAFRPLDFGRKSAKEQLDILLRAMGKAERKEELDALYKRAYDDRQVINREAKALRARADAAGEIDESLLTGDRSVDELTSQLEDITAAELAFERWGHEKQAAVSDHDEARAKVEQLNRELQAATQRHAAAVARMRTIDERKPAQPNPSAKEEVRKALAGLEDHNAKCRAARAAKDLHRQSREAMGLADEANAEVERLASERIALLQGDAILPGLRAVEGQGLSMDGVPFGSLNHQAQVQVAMELAIRQNPKLRVVLVDNAESLDREHLEHLLKVADRHELQVIATQVDQDGGDLSFDIMPTEEAGAE